MSQAHPAEVMHITFTAGGSGYTGSRGENMKTVIGPVTGEGVAAFFFFSWIIQLLRNSIVAGHLGLLKPLSYLQAAGLWFLITLLFAWVGIRAGAMPTCAVKPGIGRRSAAGWKPASGKPWPVGPKVRPMLSVRDWARRSRRRSSANSGTG